MFLHSAQLLWVPCDYPIVSLYFTLPNAIFFIYLFNDFYVKSYKQRNAKAKLEAEETARNLQENNNAVKQEHDQETGVDVILKHRTKTVAKAAKNDGIDHRIEETKEEFRTLLSMRSSLGELLQTSQKKQHGE